MSLQQLKDRWAIAVHGMTAQEAWSRNICVQCKQPALSKCPTEAGRREYLISALCERCFDAMVG